jgi:hypothetical protein
MNGASGKLLLEAGLPGAALVAQAFMPGREAGGLKEVESMLAERIDSWNQKLKEEGQQEGEARALLRLLERRFGAVDTGTRDRIAAADSDLLLRWIDRFPDAETLTEVFDLS